MGNNKYYDRRTGKWAPTSYKQRQFNSEMVGAHTDYQIRREPCIIPPFAILPGEMMC